MFKKYLVEDKFYNETAVQVKIPIQVDFYEYFKKSLKIGSLIRLQFRLKFRFK